MRHNNATNPLGRKTAHRHAMLSNMASSLILHKRIKTTTAKAKALRIFIEPILTKSKVDSTQARRYAFSSLKDKKAVHELFKEVSPKIADRPGGYTRILKLGTRPGDAAEVCYIELVDFNETMLAAKAGAAGKTTRRSRRGGSRKKQGEDTHAVEAGAKGKAKQAESVKKAEETPETNDAGTPAEPENKE